MNWTVWNRICHSKLFDLANEKHDDWYFDHASEFRCFKALNSTLPQHATILATEEPKNVPKHAHHAVTHFSYVQWSKFQRENVRIWPAAIVCHHHRVGFYCVVKVANFDVYLSMRTIDILMPHTHRNITHTHTLWDTARERKLRKSWEHNNNVNVEWKSSHFHTVFSPRLSFLTATN